MSHLKEAALLSIQLLAMCHVFAGPVHHRSILVSRGESVMLTCNSSKANIAQINWRKGRSVFAYLISENVIFSNLTSQRLRIDKNSPSKLHVFNVQHDDAGLYNCTVTARDGLRTTVWNVTVSEKPEEISSSWFFLYVLASVIGLLLCGLTSAVCLCRKQRARTPNQNPVQDQFYLETGGEVVVPQPQADTERRTNDKQRSQYMERLNSIYGVH